MKRRKLREEYAGKTDKSRTLTKEMLLPDSDEFLGLEWLTSDPEAAARVLQSLARTLPNLEEKQQLELGKSNDFWSLNKRYENEIDVMLCKLKQIDYNVPTRSRSSKSTPTKSQRSVAPWTLSKMP